MGVWLCCVCVRLGKGQYYRQYQFNNQKQIWTITWMKIKHRTGNLFVFISFFTFTSVQDSIHSCIWYNQPTPPCISLGKKKKTHQSLTLTWLKLCSYTPQNITQTSNSKVVNIHNTKNTSVNMPVKAVVLTSPALARLLTTPPLARLLSWLPHPWWGCCLD